MRNNNLGPLVAVLAVAIVGIVIFGWLASTASNSGDVLLTVFMAVLAALIAGALVLFLVIVWWLR